MSGYTSRKYVAFVPNANTGNVPSYVVVTGVNYRLDSDLANATFWLKREDALAYFKALYPNLAHTFLIHEVELRVLPNEPPHL